MANDIAVCWRYLQGQKRGFDRRAAEPLAWLDRVIKRAVQPSCVRGFETLYQADHGVGLNDEKGCYPNRHGWYRINKKSFCGSGTFDDTVLARELNKKQS